MRPLWKIDGEHNVVRDSILRHDFLIVIQDAFKQTPCISGIVMPKSFSLLPTPGGGCSPFFHRPPDTIAAPPRARWEGTHHDLVVGRRRMSFVQGLGAKGLITTGIARFRSSSHVSFDPSEIGKKKNSFSTALGTLLAVHSVVLILEAFRINLSRFITNDLSQGALMILIDTAMIAAALKITGGRMRALSWKRDSRAIALGLLLSSIGIAVLNVLLSSIGQVNLVAGSDSHINRQGLLHQTNGWDPNWATSLRLLVMGPVREELIFRGYFLRELVLMRFGVIASSTVTAGMFALFHVDSWLNAPNLVMHFISGLLFSIIFLVSSSNVVSATTAHMVWNCVCYIDECRRASHLL